jgi:hypothetical protein
LDDNFEQDVYSVDNGLTTSRFRLVGSGRINSDLQAGFMMELDIRIGARSNPDRRRRPSRGLVASLAARHSETASAVPATR